MNKLKLKQTLIPDNAFFMKNVKTGSLITCSGFYKKEEIFLITKIEKTSKYFYRYFFYVLNSPEPEREGKIFDDAFVAKVYFDKYLLHLLT